MNSDYEEQKGEQQENGASSTEDCSTVDSPWYRYLRDKSLGTVQGRGAVLRGEMTRTNEGDGRQNTLHAGSRRREVEKRNYARRERWLDLQGRREVVGRLGGGLC